MLFKGLFGTNANGTARAKDRSRKRPQKEPLKADKPRSAHRHRRALSDCSSLFPKSLPFASFKQSGQPPPNSPSPLLALPAEIRLHIYSFVLGEKDVYKVQLPGHSDRQAYWDRGRYVHWAERPKPRSSGLALLQCCRQIYHESVDLLYGRVQSLEVSWSNAYFPKGYEAPDLASVICPCPAHGKAAHGLENWLWMCKVVVERMPGLKILKIELFTIWNFRILIEDVAQILRPLRQLRGLENLEVEINPLVWRASPWRVEDLVEDIKSMVIVEHLAPCRRADRNLFEWTGERAEFGPDYFGPH